MPHIGDLDGIRQRLDYLVWLGVDAIFVAIPAIAENKNTRRYWEDFWLADLDSNQD
jgi:glycosidase